MPASGSEQSISTTSAMRARWAAFVRAGGLADRVDVLEARDDVAEGTAAARVGVDDHDLCEVHPPAGHPGSVPGAGRGCKPQPAPIDRTAAARL
jgi:hypothetical protein